MAESESVEQLLRKLHGAMKKQGTQAQQFKFGSEVIKISLQPDNHLLSGSSETSLEKEQSIYQHPPQETAEPRKQTNKKISLSRVVSQEFVEASNACFRNFFQEEQSDEESPNCLSSRPDEILWTGEVNEHINFLLSNHPESKDHIQAVLSKLEEVESANKSRRKVQQQISHMLSESLNASQKINIFDSESTLLSLSKISDPLCRLVSTHLKNLSNGSLKSPNETPSFLFLYSQPLLSLSIDGEPLPLLSQIDYEKEEQNIRKVLKECKVGYLRECATVERVGTWIQSGIEMIHFCGHGVKGQKHNEGDFLVFEDRDGKAEFVGGESIEHILKKLKRPLQFVFVASCHSKMLGDVFLKAGVPHVVCVRREERILDEACQEFVRLFYLSCLNNGMSICDSFDFAKLQVSLMGFPKGEEHKFILLKKESSIYENHHCNSLSTARCGEFRDLTGKPIYGRNIPSKVENFVVRHQIMYEVISALSNHRFITIKGIPGIGKSTLVRQLTRYMHFRGKFKDGILYTQLAGCQTVDSLFQSLSYEIFSGVGSTKAGSTKASFDDCLESIAAELNTKHVLVIIDNCDSLLASNDRIKFKQIIESLLRRCHHTHLLFSNRTRVGDSLHSCELQYCTERVFNLDKLNFQDAKNLFLSRAPRTILSEELNELLRIEKVMDLKHHPLFEFLNGHPQAITLSAALLADRSLKQVYQLLMTQSLADEFVVKHDEKRGYNAFRVSLEVSWNIIKKREPQAALMFRIMGMIPAGLDCELMPRVFGGKWRDAVKVLNKYSLLKKTERLGSNYFSIHPFMISYAESLIELEEKRRFHDKITEEMSRRVFDKVYKTVGTLSTSSQSAAELYLIEQVNYKACIYREYSFQGDTSKIRSFYRNLFNHLDEEVSDEEASENQRRDTDSIRSSTSSTSKFMSENTSHMHRKFRDEQGSDDDSKVTDQRGKLIANKQRSPRGEQQVGFKNKKKDPPAILRLMLYQATVLFIVKNFSACERIVSWGLELSNKLKSAISQANFYRLLACLSLIRKQQTRARDLFSKALEIFALIGCGLGTASCQSALGYIRFLEEEYAQAKKNLESALKYYEQIPHLFGKHYLNRWLYSIKSKINREKNQLLNHNEQAKKLLKETKRALKGNKIDDFLCKHKAGCFVFRFMFDNISLFLECSFEIDVKPKKIPLSSLKDQSILKSIATFDTPAPKKSTRQSELLPISQDEQKSVLQMLEDIENGIEGIEGIVCQESISDIDKKEIDQKEDDMFEDSYEIENNLMGQLKQLNIKKSNHNKPKELIKKDLYKETNIKNRKLIAPNQQSRKESKQQTRIIKTSKTETVSMIASLTRTNSSTMSKVSKNK